MRNRVNSRCFLRAAGASAGVASPGSLAAGAAAAQRGRGGPPPPPSFPGLANPLEDIEVLSTGIQWSEGPVWVVGDDGYLLFSDVPGNAIYCWDGERTTVFLAPS